MEIEKDRLFFAGWHVPNDRSLAVSGVEHRLFRFRQTNRPRGGAPALWKVLQRALRHVKQGNDPAVSNDRSYSPSSFRSAQKSYHRADHLDRTAGAGRKQRADEVQYKQLVKANVPVARSTADWMVE